MNMITRVKGLRGLFFRFVRAIFYELETIVALEFTIALCRVYRHRQTHGKKHECMTNVISIKV